MPLTARSRVTKITMLAATSLSLVACAGDTTAPKAVPTPSALRTSPFVPSPAQRALVGVSDGTYTFTIDPSQDQSLALGASRLDIPANAVCELATSSYGAAYWNDACAPETAPVTITAVVKDAATDHPSVEFQPAMRFSPLAQVNLYLYVTDDATLDNSKVMKYCNEHGCVDEAVGDPELRSNVDVEHKVVFRRIKHFSGYVVTNLVEEVGDLLGGW
jgi:hypothetical protein